MKRIFFTQQKPFDYMPLRAGLGYISNEELREYAVFNGSKVKDAILKMHQQSCPSLTDLDLEYNPEMLCQKVYTTRLHPLSGEYYVVEGSRYKAKLVEPRIEFRAETIAKLDLSNDSCYLLYNFFKNPSSSTISDKLAIIDALNRGGLTFAELDLGVKGAAFTDLKNELLRLNKGTTAKPIYVNRLHGNG